MGDTAVARAPTRRVWAPGRSFGSVVAIQESSAVEVPAERLDRFRRALDRQLRGKGSSDGPELVVKWRFVEFAKASQLKRIFYGGGAGQGTLKVEATFCDPAGEELAVIRSDCYVQGGVFGGSNDDIIDECAADIARYAGQTFLGEPSIGR